MAERATSVHALSFRAEGKLCRAYLKRTTADNAPTRPTSSPAGNDWHGRLVCMALPHQRLRSLEGGNKWPFHKHLDFLDSSQQRSARQTYWR
jgi:hypothetical protein